MANIEVEHRGYTIRFNENSDEWSCSDAGYYSSPSLAKVRARIDKMLLDARKAAAVSAFELVSGYSGKPALVSSKIIEFVGSHQKRTWRGTETEVEHKVASVAQRSGSERASRRECNLHELAPDTPEVHAAFAAYVQAYRAQKDAERVAAELFKAIPRLTLDDIEALVRIASAGEVNE